MQEAAFSCLNCFAICAAITSHSSVSGSGQLIVSFKVFSSRIVSEKWIASHFSTPTTYHLTSWLAPTTFLRDQSQQSTPTLTNPLLCVTNHNKAPPTTNPSPFLRGQSQKSALPQATNHIKAPPQSDQSHQSTPHIAANHIKTPYPKAANHIKAPHY